MAAWGLAWAQVTVAERRKRKAGIAGGAYGYDLSYGWGAIAA
jgi:hypothetical protein